MPNDFGAIGQGLLNGGAGGGGTSAIGLLFATLLGKFLNDQAAKDNINSKEALRTLNPYVTQAQNMLAESQRGETTNPMLATARTSMQDRVATPVTPPPTYNPYKGNPGYGQTDPTIMGQLKTSTMAPPVLATQPNRFNPYSTNSTQGQLDPTLLSKAMGIAMGGTQNPTTAWGNNILQNSMANRFGSRGMRSGNTAGALTPTGLPQPITAPTPTPSLGGNLNPIDQGYKYGGITPPAQGTNPMDAILKGMQFGGAGSNGTMPMARPTPPAMLNPVNQGGQYGDTNMPNIQALLALLMQGQKNMAV